MGTVSIVFGGIGLFLLGMTLMTDGLKALAGETLKEVLRKFTGGLFTSIFSGAIITAIVQSSSATILMTIGFVSAGLLSFSQAVGVIIGANLGSTSMGWLVSIIGFKVSMSTLALPLIGFGAFLQFFSKGRFTAHGLAVAGFGLLFMGIGILQEGMSGVTEYFNLEALGGSTLWQKAVLVLVGIVMTVVMQSSGAAVVVTLTALVAGALSFEQAAVLGIGQNIGTTVKAFIATLGGTVAAKRTALAHIGFNLFIGLIAFICLPLLIALVFALGDLFHNQDIAVSLALFHTLIYALGILIIIPILPYFRKFIVRLVPDKGQTLTKYLDPSVTTIAPVAIEAVRRTLIIITKKIVAAAYELYSSKIVSVELSRQLEEAHSALSETRHFLSQISDASMTKKDYVQQIALVHVIDHLARMLKALKEPEFIEYLTIDQTVLELAARMEAVLLDIKQNLTDERLEDLLSRVEANSKIMAEIRRKNRKVIIETSVLSQADVDDAIQNVHTLHWIDRIAYHLWRSMYHLYNYQYAEDSLDDE